MRLTIWDLFKYIYKHKLLIIIGTVCSLIAANLYVKKIQTYSAEVVIRYKDTCVSEGRALDGSEFDSNEIVSPKVIASADRNLPFEITDDGIRANTKIIPIIPSSEQSLQDANEKQGEEYEYHPNTFRIKYKGNSSYYQTRDTLDKLIDSYFKYYNEKYLYLATISEIDHNINNGEYDYLEQAEILQNNIDNSIEVLQSYVGNNSYRSPSTGLTFNDMIDKFNYMSEFKIPLIFSKIYAARLSSDKNLLINKYTERKEQNELKNKNSSEKALMAEDRMNAYVGANVNVPNSYNYNSGENDDNVMIIQDVHDGNRENRVDAETTYDSLIKNYVADSIAANSSTIDAEHCQNVIDIFSTPANQSIDYAAYETDVKNEISDTLEDLKDMYATAFKLIDDYNAYVPAQHIECLTGVRYYENVYASFYYLIALVIGFIFLCMLSIAIEVIKRYASFGKKIGRDGGENDGKAMKEAEEDR